MEPREYFPRRHRLVDVPFLSRRIRSSKVDTTCISKIVEALRDVGSLMNKVEIKDTYSTQLKIACEQYTVWTIGYIVVPFHGNEISMILVTEFYRCREEKLSTLR